MNRAMFTRVGTLLLVFLTAALAVVMLSRRLFPNHSLAQRSSQDLALSPSSESAVSALAAGSGQVPTGHRSTPALAPLQAELMGTVVGRQPREAQAFLLDTSQPRRLILALGEPFQGRVLSHVGRGFVKFRRPDGNEDSLFLENTQHPEAIIQAVGAGGYRVDRRRLAEAVHGDASQLLSQAQLKPHLEGFQLAGVRLARVEPRSLVAQAGFGSDDVITAINGKPLDSPSAALAAYHAARHGRELSVEVARHGKLHTLRYFLD